MLLDEVEQVKQRIDIVEFISSYLTVKKAGANYRALCPFHHEKTPSMMISPDKQIFKCFGCAASGDVISFLMKMENLNFREALEVLAARAGVELVKKTPDQIQAHQEEENLKARLYNLNMLVARFWQKILLDHPVGQNALEYLKSRGLTIETIKLFLLGYAPGKISLLKWLSLKNFTENEIQESGSPDRFFKRIVFPITNPLGQVIGFTGRATEFGQEPKYYNSPETSIFHKSRTLYNLERAKVSIRQNQAVVVVEGQMDVISSYQAGVENVVATSGTALTVDHLQILGRFVQTIIFAFDTDNAGLTTQKKAYEMAIAQGLNVKMVIIPPPYKDPGEFSIASPESWQKAVQNAIPVVDWYFNLVFGPNIKNTDQLTSIQKKEIAKELLPIIKKIPDKIEQAHYVGVLARKLKIAEEVIFNSLNNVIDKKPDKNNKEQTENQKAKLTDEAILVGLLTLAPKNIEKASLVVKTEDLPEDLKLLYSKLLTWYNDKRTDKLGEFLKSKLKDSDFQKLEGLQIELENDYPNINQVIDDLLANFQAHKQEKMKQFYAEAIAKAEEDGDREKLKQLVKEFQNAISQ